MRIALNVAGVLLVLMGVIWILQGTSVLPGSFMTGQMQWAVYGAVSLVVGLVSMLTANGRKPRK